MNATELDKLLLGPVQPLNPELADYLTDTNIGPCIKHPLVYSIMHHEKQNALVNAQLAAKQRSCEDAKNAGSWHQYVFLHERPWRLDALSHIVKHLNPEEYWPLIGQIWTDSENIWENIVTWAQRLHNDMPARHLIMSQSERDALAALPDTFTVYRGYNAIYGGHGLSWTLDEDRARWFANRFAPELPSIITGTLAKTDVIAYFTGRNEDEIVTLPWNIDGKVTSPALSSHGWTRTTNHPVNSGTLCH